MKISAWHKSQGDTVEWCLPLDHYDIVCQSKVFDETYSPDIELQRWVNNKFIFRSCERFEDYKKGAESAK